jgi:Domain of unknown function (DUF4351)
MDFYIGNSGCGRGTEIPLDLGILTPIVSEFNALGGQSCPRLEDRTIEVSGVICVGDGACNEFFGFDEVANLVVGIVSHGGINEKGNVRGRQDEAQGLILHQLNRRVGSVSIDLATRIKALPLAQLEELGEVLLDFSQMNDLVAWLDVNRSQV